METINPDSELNDTCNVNGDCTLPMKNQSMDLNHAKNIDDISTPSELKFDEDFEFEDPDVTAKRKEIEKCLENPNLVNVEQWQSFAKSKGGLIADEYRRRIWPLLVGVTQDEMTDPPSLDELSTHIEYNQVELDVKRSLKRFPPGIPYEQRVALQDQLTVLILRVIMEYPHLKYYQGYHDVAITLLLVCGDRASFPLLCRLSYGPKAPLAPFMQATMQPTQHLLNYMLPVIRRADDKLADYLDKAGVGTMFALPWYLTWFGHSLNRYSDVVRLYDYFLCAPPLFPVYVTAALVLQRAPDVFACECDMAMMHCLLSRRETRRPVAPSYPVTPRAPRTPAADHAMSATNERAASSCDATHRLRRSLAAYKKGVLVCELFISGAALEDNSKRRNLKENQEESRLIEDSPLCI